MSSSSQPVILGTRGSALALAQSGLVRDMLRKLHPRLAFELKVIKTSGDRKAAPKVMPEFGLKGLWTREIEVALTGRRVDVGIHSLKDLPTLLPAGLVLGATPKRGDPRDVLITRGPRFAELPDGAVVGTASLRRQGQLLALRPDLRVVEARGNVETRLNKLEANTGWHAIVLAAAGLDRLNLKLDKWGFVAHPFGPEEMLPAPCQAILGLEIRADDERIAELLRRLNHYATFQTALAERAFAHALGAGCRTPVAGYAVLSEGRLALRGAVFGEDGRVKFRGEISGPETDAEKLGATLGEQAKSKLA